MSNFIASLSWGRTFRFKTNHDKSNWFLCQNCLRTTTRLLKAFLSLRTICKAILHLNKRFQVCKASRKKMGKKVIWNHLRSLDECVMSDSMPPLRPRLVPHVFSINGIASLSFGWVMDTYSMLPPCCLETPGLQAYTEPKLGPEPQCWSASEVFDRMPNRFQSWSPPQSRGKDDIWDTERIWMNLNESERYVSPYFPSAFLYKVGTPVGWPSSCGAKEPKTCARGIDSNHFPRRDTSPR